MSPGDEFRVSLDIDTQQGVEQSVIALWLGHETIETTQVYLDTDLELNQRVLDAVTPPMPGFGV